MASVSDSEREDFKTEILQNGRNVSDFELLEEAESFPDQGVGPVTGSVTVRNRKTDRKQTYKTGDRTAWVVAFRDDLRAGAYD
jgi:hypothetical protein